MDQNIPNTGEKPSLKKILFPFFTYLILLPVWLVGFAFVAMLGDATGVGDKKINPMIHLLNLAYSVVPISIFGGLVISLLFLFLFRDYKTAKIVVHLPILNLIIVLLAFVLSSLFCGGKTTC